MSIVDRIDPEIAPVVAAIVGRGLDGTVGARALCSYEAPRCPDVTEGAHTSVLPRPSSPSVR
jgi:hypothetical protein